MNIAWLWHFTDTTNTESLRTTNEKNAFAAYARWRALLRWTARLYAPIQLSFQKRATHAKLMALPDYLLTDIGMYRAGNEIKVDVVRHPGIEEDAVLKADKNKVSRCVVIPVVPATRTHTDRGSSDDASRAA